jgi:spore coat polysaccharide biosynthesis protein SpsF
MKVGVFIQARMGSERLPGKVLLQVLKKPLLVYLLERAKKIKEADLVAVLTSTQKKDEAIEKVCREENVLCFRGDELDVLDRYFKAAKKYQVDAIVRITADCPLLDPHIADHVISFFKKHAHEFDYVSNTINRKVPRGMDVEVFSLYALQKAHQEAKEMSEREHVTLHLYKHPETYRIHGIRGEQDYSDLRLTVDTQEDFMLIEKVLSSLYPQKKDFLLPDILQLFQKKPELKKINAHIAQKSIS